jgi:hypothetical protein
MVGGEGIRSCDLRFIRRDSQPIELPLETRYSRINAHLFLFPFLDPKTKRLVFVDS